MEYYWPKRFGTFKVYDSEDDPDLGKPPVDAADAAGAAPAGVAGLPHPAPLAHGNVKSDDEDDYNRAQAQSQVNQPEDG